MNPDHPADLNSWSLHCFCLHARVNPKRIIGLDNNGRVLLHAVGGTTSGDLDRVGVPVSESQLALLETFGLMVRDGGSFRTRFPILFPDVIRQLRESIHTSVAAIQGDLLVGARAIESALEDRNLEGSVESVIFGHALDGELWDLLRSRGEIPDTRPTIEEPFWRGSFWAAYPGRALSAGTNERSEDDAVLVMVWDDETADQLRAFETDQAVGLAMRSIEPGAMVMRVDVEKVIPVIRRLPDDPVHVACRELAGQLASLVPSVEECRTRLADWGVEVSTQDAVVIFAHELIWETMTSLAKPGSGVADDPVSRLFVRLG